MSLTQINFRLAPVQADALGLAAQASGRTKSEIMRRGLQSEIEKTLREFGETVVVEPVEVGSTDVRGKAELLEDAEIRKIMDAGHSREYAVRLLEQRARKKKR
jgi:hypothetical protein